MTAIRTGSSFLREGVTRPGYPAGREPSAIPNPGDQATQGDPWPTSMVWAEQLMLQRLRVGRSPSTHPARWIWDRPR